MKRLKGFKKVVAIVCMIAVLSCANGTRSLAVSDSDSTTASVKYQVASYTATARYSFSDSSGSVNALTTYGRDALYIKAMLKTIKYANRSTGKVTTYNGSPNSSTGSSSVSTSFAYTSNTYEIKYILTDHEVLTPKEDWTSNLFYQLRENKN